MFCSPEILLHELPAKPSWVIGRDSEQSDIIKSVLAGKPVVILGSGGIGKTTLALTVLYDEKVVKKYKHQYFVSCEGITSINLLLGELVKVLGIPLEAQDQYLKERILHT